MTKTFSHDRRRALTAGMFLAITAGCAGTRTRESTGEFIDDSAVTAKVKTTLLDNIFSSGATIRVETFRGVVQLGGHVENARDKQRAETLARTVAGVKSVVNDIEVR